MSSRAIFEIIVLAVLVVSIVMEIYLQYSLRRLHKELGYSEEEKRVDRAYNNGFIVGIACSMMGFALALFARTLN